MEKNNKKHKEELLCKLKKFITTLNSYISTEEGQWTVKGFIDVFRNIYTISSDTKIVSKILEIHLFPKILQFAEENNYKFVLAEQQNYYPDISLIKSNNENIKFAIDFKTTYRLPEKKGYCNGFTLGSHGKYFANRESKKNIQFPYSDYSGHFCLGIIYTRTSSEYISETTIYDLSKLRSITSVIKDIEFFIAEKWQIASDKSGSGNTANIGSINNIEDIINGNGMFRILGEEWFDDYWINYGKIKTKKKGKLTYINNLRDFVSYRKGDTKLIVSRSSVKKAVKSDE